MPVGRPLPGRPLPGLETSSQKYSCATHGIAPASSFLAIPSIAGRKTESSELGTRVNTSQVAPESSRNRKQTWRRYRRCTGEMQGSPEEVRRPRDAGEIQSALQYLVQPQAPLAHRRAPERIRPQEENTVPRVNARLPAAQQRAQHAEYAVPLLLLPRRARLSGDVPAASFARGAQPLGLLAPQEDTDLAGPRDLQRLHHVSVQVGQAIVVMEPRPAPPQKRPPS